jgi:hypothetical protein
MSDDAQITTAEVGDPVDGESTLPAADAAAVGQVSGPATPSGTGPSDALAPELRAAADSLADLDEAPLTEHIERYQQIHRGLQDALSGIEGV